MIDLPLLIGNWILDNNLEFIHHCRTPLNCQITRKHNCTLYLGKDLFIIYRGDTATSAIMLEEVDCIGVMYYETDTIDVGVRDVRYPRHLGEIKELKLWVGDPEWDKTLLGIIKNGTGGEIHGTRFS